MRWIRIVGFVILTVGGFYFTAMLLLASWLYAGAMNTYGSEPVSLPSFALKMLGVVCFGFTAIAFGVSGLWQTVVELLRDRKAKAQPPAQTH